MRCMRTSPHVIRCRPVEVDVLVVGEGGVGGTDGYRKQQHVLCMGLARQRGEESLCFLVTTKRTHTQRSVYNIQTTINISHI